MKGQKAVVVIQLHCFNMICGFNIDFK